MSLPEPLARIAAEVLGHAVTAATSVAGGDLNEAWRLELDDGTRAFVKTSPEALPGSFAAEAAGLKWLAEPGGLPVAEVLGVRDPDDADADGPRLLALAWIEQDRAGGRDSEQLGRGLAAVHAAGAGGIGHAPPGAPGGERAPLRLGPLRIPNADAPDWPTFYAASRVMPVAEMAVKRGALTGEDMEVIGRLCERMADFAGPSEPPARLHGDLWSGNVIWGGGGAPHLIDPAAYAGHREMDLAMLSLFGDPGKRFRAAYEEVTPLAEGHADRVALWHLFPLLVHAALFGGGYGSSAVRTARRYVG